MTGKQKVVAGICCTIIAVNGFALAILVPQISNATQPETPPPSAVKATTTPPHTSDPLQRAEFYFAPEQYDMEKARQYYTQVITEDPNQSALAWYQLSRINFLEGKFSAGLHNLQRKLDIFGDEIPNTYYMKGLIYAFRADWYGNKSDWERAANNFEKFLEYYDASPWARIDLAWVYFSIEQYEEMLTVLTPIAERESTNPWFLNMYALALFHTDQQVRATDAITQAHEQIQNTTIADWASVYPENDPDEWPIGLAEFTTAVERNLKLITAQN